MAAAHVFALARGSPGALLLRSNDLSPGAAAHPGRVPFDLVDFCARSSSSPGLPAFVRAYFCFLDTRSLFAAQDLDAEADDEDTRLDRLWKRQHLLELLMQIRPYMDSMEKQSLVLEAMDCVVIEIFEVYSQVCTGIVRFLVGDDTRRGSGPGALIRRGSGRGRREADELLADAMVAWLGFLPVDASGRGSDRP
ncbi:putative clathrin assembly protein At1g25240 [Brachypodium distachyon]|uniref:putative clathrin assembly protein At1g25240 n=1 Tax=Brachypodium distachyon TaxID=15368 RepID=UPI00071D6970|nr:putative clathrin assembly protein At1g25240 [Brachypodium distachyon]|eukprot:XP_014754023.1 putative clathrin assembly protein At1g25240 [Brachypodium distachyon]